VLELVEVYLDLIYLRIESMPLSWESGNGFLLLELFQARTVYH
jgi:hypothetical protein